MSQRAVLRHATILPCHRSHPLGSHDYAAPLATADLDQLVEQYLVVPIDGSVPH